MRGVGRAQRGIVTDYNGTRRLNWFGAAAEDLIVLCEKEFGSPAQAL